MKHLFFILIAYLFFSCNNEKDITLEIVNKELLTKTTSATEDTLNIVRYKIVNNSDNIYYINSIISNIRFKPAIIIDGKNIFFRVYNSKMEEVEYDFSSVEDYDELNNDFENDLWYFYAFKADKNNFFINPKETLFFETPLRVVAHKNWDNEKPYHARITSIDEFYSKMFVTSDSSYYKKTLPKDILKKIESNNAKVYHGIIESKNTVPIRVLE